MYRTRSLSGQLITAGPGDYDPPDEGCPGCDDLNAEADRLREQLAEVRAQVDDLLVLHDEVEAERDRLARILAVERGDQCGRAGWVGPRVRVRLAAPRRRSPVGSSSTAVPARRGGAARAPSVTVSGHAPTALEAMEAADAALVGVSPC
jgi:hypothetical protein